MSAAKKRPYRLGRRGEKQQETRRRIVEAAVDLHSSLGPARTTVSDIASRAGVQRHTFYAHFPDERSLFLACSALALERDPLPDLGLLRTVPAGSERLLVGFRSFYEWYERNAEQAACVLRDAEHHALTREMVELRMAPVFREAGELLGEGLGEHCGPLIDVALDFACWRTLRRTLASSAAAALMTDAVACLPAATRPTTA